MSKASDLVVSLSLPAGHGRFTVDELTTFADERHAALEAVGELETAMREAITEIEMGGTSNNFNRAAKRLREALE